MGNGLMPATWTPISGPYTATYNGAAIGATSEGFRIRARHHVQKIHTDQTGEVAIDGINMGTEYEIECDGLEFEKIAAAMRVHSADGEALTNVGTSQLTLAKQLVLTPIGTAAGRKTYTATKAIVESDIAFMLSKGLRNGQVAFTLYPDPTTGKPYTAA